MSWATLYIKQLQDGKVVTCRPRGNSMLPLIKSGQLCTIVPIEDRGTLKVGDIVLCKVRSAQYLHLVKATRGHGEKRQFQIANNKGRVNGWVRSPHVYGRLTKVED